jgi:hypothetical protein
MGKITIVFMLGLLVVVLALSSLFIRREAFEDAAADTPGVTDMGVDPRLLGPGATNPEAPPLPPFSPPTLPPGTPLPPIPPPTSSSSAVADEKGQRATLLRDIRQVVHNELASFKGMTTASSQPLFQRESSNKVLMSEDPSLQQGAEMKAVRPTYCPKDMNQYIRKDEIPCWGCTLDY